ncbi:MAG: hypothetical protein IPI35_07905 [Deltaproteobacteria bacterium]|nr:hypothetical protein [Deltaproteobacteria bacterium]
MMSAVTLAASLNLLKSAVELVMDPEKRTVGAGIDVLAKLTTLLGQADNDLADMAPSNGCSCAADWRSRR